MRAILKREVKNYLKNPLLWLGIVSGVLMIFLNVRPYLNIHYLREGETIVYDEPETYGDADVYCGYVPTEEGLRRGLWEERIREALISVFGMDNEGAQSVIDEMKEMDVVTACAHLEGYRFYNAYSDYVNTAYRRGTREEINAYIAEKLENRTFSYYFSRKFADFAGVLMDFSQPFFCPCYLCRTPGETPMSFFIQSLSAREAMWQAKWAAVLRSA